MRHLSDLSRFFSLSKILGARLACISAKYRAMASGSVRRLNAYISPNDSSYHIRPAEAQSCLSMNWETSFQVAHWERLQTFLRTTPRQPLSRTSMRRGRIASSVNMGGG